MHGTPGKWRSILGAALAAFVLTLAAAPAAAQDAPQPQPPPKPPKLALVLSGGGAMGIAHVGAIQTLEELGIRPDLVVGASMGSIVGGLYASGMNGAELERAVSTMDWDLIFDTSPPREGLTYREKQIQTAFPVKPSVGVRNGELRPPEAIVSDANLLLELRRLVRVRAAAPTFDHLPIPFRAVATDIETGEKVVLDRGELAGAMRASMSVPGVFAPYRLDGRLLVDGGMADNVPIDVARDMGADVVIVVATQTPMAPADKLTGVTAVLGQTVTMLILANERQQLATLKPTDVLIRVDPGGLNAADFKKGDQFIALGRAAAAGQAEALRRVAATRPFTPAVSIERPPPTIDYVKVQNDSRLADEILLRRVEPFVGKPLAPDQVATTLRDIYALGVFSRVDYRIEEANGRTGLVVNAIQRPGDANRIRLGLTISSGDKGDNEFDISAEYRLTQLDRYGSEARFVGALGERRLFSAEYLKVFDARQLWFGDVFAKLQRRPIKVYDADGFVLGAYDVGTASVSLAAGRQLGRAGEIRLGVERGSGDASLQQGALFLRDFEFDIGQLFASAAFDTLDNPFFPTRGARGGLEWRNGLESLGDTRDFQSLRLDGAYATSWGRHAMILNLSGGDAVDGVLPLASQFTLGGPFNFPGYAVEELTGQAFAVGRAMYRYKLSDHSDSLFRIPLYVGATAVAGNVWTRPGDVALDDLRFGANLFVGADTIIGPMFLAIGAADDGRTAFYVFVGKPF